MNLAALSLVVFVITVAVSMIRKVNCGIAGAAAAFALTLFFVKDMELRDIYMSGWPVSTFFMMFSVLLLFGIAGSNGTMEVIAKKLIFLFGGRTRWMPFLLYVLTLVLSGSGAGPGVAPMMMGIAMGICRETGLNFLMMGMIVEIGAATGGLSPIATSGIIAKDLLAAGGVEGYMQMFVPYSLAMFAEAAAIYLFFGGYKDKQMQSAPQKAEKVVLNRHQKETLAVIVMVMIGIVFGKLDVPMTALTGAAVLLLLGTIEGKKAISSVNWNTLLMIAGMYMLITVVAHCGGIALISKGLTGLMNGKTAAGIMTFLSGVMASVTSSSGVVMPTLIPAGIHMAGQIEGVSAAVLSGSVIAGANCAIFCPFSVLGSLTIANYPEELDRQYVLKRHFQMAVCSVLFFTILGFGGFLDVLL